MLPFEFEVAYQPGSKMGITDYLGRSPHFEAPEKPPDETELILALTSKFNIRKKRAVLEAVLSKREADSVEWSRVPNERRDKTSSRGRKEMRRM